MRQASMGLTADTAAAIPSEVRNNLTGLPFLAMKCGNEQASQSQTGDRAEVPPSELFIKSSSGEAYSIKPIQTYSRFVRCRRFDYTGKTR